MFYSSCNQHIGCIHSKLYLQLTKWRFLWKHANIFFLLKVFKEPLTLPKNLGFNETTPGFKFLLQKTRETAVIRRSFTETVKKMAISPLTIKDVLQNINNVSRWGLWNFTWTVWSNLLHKKLKFRIYLDKQLHGLLWEIIG